MMDSRTAAQERATIMALIQRPLSLLACQTPSEGQWGASGQGFLAQPQLPTIGREHAGGVRNGAICPIPNSCSIS